MKLKDIYVGQRVGFVYNNIKYIGVVNELNTIDDKIIATVETDETIVEVNIKYLLGVL